MLAVHMSGGRIYRLEGLHSQDFRCFASEGAVQREP